MSDRTTHDIGTMSEDAFEAYRNTFPEPEGPLHYLYVDDPPSEQLQRLADAWERVDAVTQPAPLATQLAQSLQLQTCTLIGECYNAIDRKCLLDLIAAWARLKVALELTVLSKPHAALRRDWFWDDCREYLTQALCYGETGTTKWHVVDMLIRGEARESIHGCELSLEMFDTPESQDVADLLRRNLKLYKDCSEGRI